jgi:hypothetical protein
MRRLSQSRRARQGQGRREEPPRNGPGFRADRLPLHSAFFFTGEPAARGTIPFRERSSRGLSSSSASLRALREIPFLTGKTTISHSYAKRAYFRVVVK